MVTGKVIVLRWMCSEPEIVIIVHVLFAYLLQRILYTAVVWYCKIYTEYVYMHTINYTHTYIML